MASSQNGNAGIWSGYTPGDNGWTSQHNTNWDAIDALMQCTVKSASTTTPPGSPANGDAYIIPSGATGAWASQTGKIAAWIRSAWQFFTPKNGWEAYVQDVYSIYIYTGTAWITTKRGQQTFTSSGTFTVPPNVTTLYISACAGGGGGGGSGSASGGTSSAGGGGGAGQSITKQAYTVTPGATISITVGSGGTHGNGGAGGGSNPGAAGSAGGNTVIGTLVTLTGGSGGSGGSGPAGGAPGAGYPGGCYGQDAAAGSFGGHGASTPLGGGGFGGRGAQNTAVGTGNAGGGNGSGGGGGGGCYTVSTSAGANGGDGAPGIVIIEW